MSFEIYRRPIPTEDMKEIVIQGLQMPQKSIPAKFFYDQKGSELFEQIVSQPEYYVPETEMQILKDNVEELKETLKDSSILIEFGAGSTKKIRYLLDNLQQFKTFVPIDIAESFLIESCQALEKEYPEVEIHAICADFTRELELPDIVKDKTTQRTIFFPGSTIGNFEPPMVIQLLKVMSNCLYPGEHLLIGVDQPKDKSVLEAAYNDKAGITAAFNLNLLDRLKKDLGAQLDSSQFAHHAFFNEEKSRIEMHLVSQTDQSIKIDDQEFGFKKGESIHSENSNKFRIDLFENMAKEASFQLKKNWKDEKGYFCVALFEKV